MDRTPQRLSSPFPPLSTLSFPTLATAQVAALDAAQARQRAAKAAKELSRSAELDAASVQAFLLSTASTPSVPSF